MPYNNALFPVKSNNNVSQLRSSIGLTKLSSNAYWQFAIFLSLAIVVQAVGFNRSVRANTPNSKSTIIRQHSAKAKKSSTQIRSSTFLPRILNLIAASAKSQSFNLAQLDTAKATTPKLTPLQPIAPDQILADARFSTKSVPLIHQVKQGETITAIASEYQVSKSELVKANHLQNSNVIFVDQRLTIPARTKDVLNTSPTIANLAPIESQKAITSASKTKPTKLLQPSAEDPYIAKLKIEIEQRRAQYKQEQASKLNVKSTDLISTAEPQPEVETSTPEAKPDLSIVRRNLQSDPDTQDALALVLPPLYDSEEYLPSAFDGYTWPAQGVLTSGYGWRWGRMHRGIDIAAPIGTPIVAAAAGTVIGVGWYSGYGNMVKLEHLDGSITYYAHNHRNLVTHGQKVKQGEQIAEMGNTGHSTGPHLHFEIHLSNKQVIDPLALLSKR